MLKLGRKLFEASYVLQKMFENPIGIPERTELFAGLPTARANLGQGYGGEIDFILFSEPLYSSVTKQAQGP